jgi:cell division septation protein DedD
MQQSFNVDEVEPVAPKRDTELTLGPFMLLALFFGLALLCGLFFGLGYAVGHRGAATTQAALAQTSDAQPVSQPYEAQAKPSATTQASSASKGTETSAPASNEEADQSQTAGAESPAAAPVSNQSRTPVAQPALPAPAANPRSAAPAAGALMVQIAAVSHQEDADVLVAALRKRGYAVTASRDSADGMLHVRIGPFSSRNEANSIRNKLLSDGYNAVVQP